MKRAPLWKVSIRTTPAAEDPVTELLALVLREPTFSYTSLRTGATTVAAYVLRKPDDFPLRLEALRAGLRELKASGVDIASGRISTARVQPQNWAEVWKRHFKPIAIGRALLIRPSWIRRRLRPGQKLIGTGPGAQLWHRPAPDDSVLSAAVGRLSRPGTASIVSGFRDRLRNPGAQRRPARLPAGRGPRP